MYHNCCCNQLQQLTLPATSGNTKSDVIIYVCSQTGEKGTAGKQ